jgi:hydroxymethylglutaryl-CoA reductase
VNCQLPIGMGLGSSAAIAVAIARAVSASHRLNLDDERINSVAVGCEKLAHGNPSGIDNSIATYGQAMLFSNAAGLAIEKIQLAETPPIVIALSSRQGLTHEQVAAVGERSARTSAQYAAVFEQIDALSIAGAAALKTASYTELGALMNICHGLLNALQVSTPEIENIVGIARSAGAAGAKLTGAGGGGAVVVLCPDATETVTAALTSAGIVSLTLTGNRDA